MDFLHHLLTLPLFTLFAIVALGMWAGSFQMRGISLGAAGVLFVAFAFGYFHRIVPEVLRDLGLLLFVYAVGLQAGPRFFGILRARGKIFLTVALVSTASGAVAAVTFASVYPVALLCKILLIQMVFLLLHWLERGATPGVGYSADLYLSSLPTFDAPSDLSV